MNGNRSHLLCRPVFKDDAKEKQSGAQGPQAYLHSQQNFPGFLLDSGFKTLPLMTLMNADYADQKKGKISVISVISGEF
jgi:hypothetical protein